MGPPVTAEIVAKAAEAKTPVAPGPFEPTWDSIKANYTTPEWFRDGKFGIFIHWGPYCVPAFANEWYPRNMYKQGTKEFEHHVKTYGPHDKFGYKDFLPMFKAERFDATAWADVFKQSGARFIVPVAEHHDGFPMYDCSFTEWNAAKMGPKRDIVGQLSRAVRDAGMIVGASSHRAENYWFFNGGREIPSDVTDAKCRGLYGFAQAGVDNTKDPKTQPPPPVEHLDDWLARTCEIVDKYRPQVMWFDWWIEHRAFEPYLKRFAAYYYNRAAGWDAGAAINFKLDAFPLGTGLWDVERGQAADIRPDFWQTDTSVSRSSWGYTENQQWKTPTTIVHDLIDIVAKNGALLLNIGPKSDGTIPDEEQKILLEIGKWLGVNGEAIYGTRPWRVFGEAPTVHLSGSFTDNKKRDPFTSADIRFTTSPDTLYATLLEWPAHGRALVRSLSPNLRLWSGAMKSVRILGCAEALNWSIGPDGLRVQLPERKPCDHAYVLKIEK